MLDSASVNSNSSMPSPVYQWRKALRLNMAENCNEKTRETTFKRFEVERLKMDIVMKLSNENDTWDII